MPTRFVVAFFSAFLLIACDLSESDNECASGDGGCDGNVARVCEYWKDPSCEREGGCWSNGSGYKWSHRDCGALTCVGNGICSPSTTPDPRCSGVGWYCDGIVGVECEDGFATRREEGYVVLVGVDELTVGDRAPFTLERRSTCGELDVTQAVHVSSKEPSVLVIEDGMLVARRIGRASIVTDDGAVVGEVDVVGDCSEPSAGTSVTINTTPDHVELNVGESMDLSASAFWDTGRRCSKMVDEEPDGGWESEDEAIVTVDATGRVTAVGLGLAVVRPHWRGVTSSGSMIHVVE